MFPTIGDIFSFFLGIKIPLPINTFGFFLASSILFAAWLISKELKRLHEAGLLPSITIMGKDKKLVTVGPQEGMGNTATIAAITGIIGARLFHILEYPQDFIEDPIGMIFSRGGFTFYGGLAFGTLGVMWYFRKLKLPYPRSSDAFGPGLMGAYALGRLGCQLSGDGDWGIAADMSLKPAWLPDWMWAQTYTGNVVGQVIPAPGVYPTPMYESASCFALLGVLWLLRRHNHQPSWLFWIYLFLCGIERFFIERIRVNSHYEIFGISATQAEIIALGLISVGIAGMAKTWPRSKATAQTVVAKTK